MMIDIANICLPAKVYFVGSILFFIYMMFFRINTTIGFRSIFVFVIFLSYISLITMLFSYFCSLGENEFVWLIVICLPIITFYPAMAITRHLFKKNK